MDFVIFSSRTHNPKSKFQNPKFFKLAERVLGKDEVISSILIVGSTTLGILDFGFAILDLYA